MSRSFRPIITKWGTPCNLEFGSLGTPEVLFALCETFGVECIDCTDDGSSDGSEFIVTEGAKFCNIMNAMPIEPDALADLLIDDWLLSEAKAYAKDGGDDDFKGTLVYFINDIANLAATWLNELDDGELKLYLD